MGRERGKGCFLWICKFTSEILFLFLFSAGFWFLRHTEAIRVWPVFISLNIHAPGLGLNLIFITVID